MNRWASALLLVLWAGHSPAQTPLERFEASLFTVEVHAGNHSSRTSQGSGYAVPGDGLVVTNYHVVSSYVRHPDRYRIRVRNATGNHDAELVRFDLINDLALLRVHGLEAPPLEVAAEPPAGSRVLAFGNPHGLGISQIEGTHNGRADKGLVPRMLLSMPLNSGMSGGPIVDADGRVVGTNVAVIWLENSLSFGVPGELLSGLLEGPPLAITPAGLRDETTRQLLELESSTSAAVLAGFAGGDGEQPVRVGGLRALRPPDMFECWDHVEEFSAEGIVKSQYGCDLQFTPSLEDLGPVASVQVLFEHFSSADSRYGFYGWLGDHAQGHHGAYPVAPRDPDLSPPHCTGDRVDAASMRFDVETCVYAYVRHPGLFDANLVATSLDSSEDVAFVALDLSGVRLETVTALTRLLLDGLRLEEAP